MDGAATQYAGTLSTCRTLMGERRFAASRRPLCLAAMRPSCASELFPPTSVHGGDVCGRARTRDISSPLPACRIPLALRTQASITVGVCLHLPHSVCGLLVLCAVRTQLSSSLCLRTPDSGHNATYFKDFDQNVPQNPRKFLASRGGRSQSSKFSPVAHKYSFRTHQAVSGAPFGSATGARGLRDD